MIVVRTVLRNKPRNRRFELVNCRMFSGLPHKIFAKILVALIVKHKTLKEIPSETWTSVNKNFHLCAFNVEVSVGLLVIPKC